MAIPGQNQSNLRIDIQEFTSSGTWNKPIWADETATVEIELIGGGGGADDDGGTGGAGGGRTLEVIPASILSATESVTIGAGGDTANSPTDGGDTIMAGFLASGGTRGSGVQSGGDGASQFGGAASGASSGAAGANALSEAGAVARAYVPGVEQGDRNDSSLWDKRGWGGTSGHPAGYLYGGGAHGTATSGQDGAPGYARVTTRRG